ncbi:MAG: AAA family ATPase [Steroidobacteraceae bacterium]
MNTPPFPPAADLEIGTEVYLREHTFPHAMLQSLLATAHARRDATFSVMRETQMAVRRDPGPLLDQLAVCGEWLTLRPYLTTLILRATGVFGTIEVTGTPEHCTVSIQVWTDTPERGDATVERILAGIRPYRIADVAFSLHWRFLDGQGNVTRASTEERASEELLDEAYPALSGVSPFIEEYLKSPETVLVLQGSPGTGKTRLIRAILGAISQRRGETAEVLYSGDCAVLKSDEVFLQFIAGDYRAFVVEDADHLLAPRSEGNHTLHRFLNIADGIASAHGKKIIFSTNLPNIHDIDEALVRPGRCFAHLYLEELQPAEAVRLLDRLCEQSPKSRAAALAHLRVDSHKSFSVAEVYSAFRHAGPQLVRMRFPRHGIARGRDRVAFGFN